MWILEKRILFLSLRIFQVRNFPIGLCKSWQCLLFLWFWCLIGVEIAQIEGCLLQLLLLAAVAFYFTLHNSMMRMLSNYLNW